MNGIEGFGQSVTAILDFSQKPSVDDRNWCCLCLRFVKKFPDSWTISHKLPLLILAIVFIFELSIGVPHRQLIECKSYNIMVCRDMQRFPDQQTRKKKFCTHKFGVGLNIAIVRSRGWMCKHISECTLKQDVILNFFPITMIFWITLGTHLDYSTKYLLLLTRIGTDNFANYNCFCLF